MRTRTAGVVFSRMGFAAKHAKGRQNNLLLWRHLAWLAGIKNVLTKCLGSHNPHNAVKATMVALQMLASPEDVAARRNRPLAEILG